MKHLLNVMRGQAVMANQQVVPNRQGTVSAYDPNRYAVKVQFPPDEVETGWIPLDAVWVGNGWGFFAPPALGDQVAVTFQDGGQDAGVVTGRFFDDLAVPLPVQPGEMWMVHQSGQFIKLTNDGKLTLSDGSPGGAALTFQGAGQVLATGNWTFQNPVTMQQGLTVNGTLENNGIDVSTHGHQSTTPGTRTGNMET